MLSKFNFTFTWKYCGDGELRSILPDVFRILDDEDERYMDDQKMQYSWLLNDLFLLKIIFKVLQNICLSMYYTLLQFLQLVKQIWYIPYCPPMAKHFPPPMFAWYFFLSCISTDVVKQIL